MNNNKINLIAKNVIQDEIFALKKMKSSIGSSLNQIVKTIVNCCINVKSIPGKICAINNTPAHSYNGVPSILTVAPKGSTKPEVVFETLTLSRTQDMVTGRVALEELVENAIIIAFLIALK